MAERMSSRSLTEAERCRLPPNEAPRPGLEARTEPPAARADKSSLPDA